MDRKKGTAPGALYAVLAAALYAVHIPFSKQLLDHVPAAMLAGLLNLGAGIGMAALWAAGRLTGGLPRGERFGTADLRYILGMIVLDMAAPILLLNGLGRITAANAALLGNFEMAVTAVAAFLLFGKAASKRLWCAIGLVIVASVMLSCEISGSSLTFSPGSALVLGAYVCWGLKNNCTQMLAEKDPLKIVLIKGLCAGAALVGIGMFSGQHVPYGKILIIILFLGFVSFGLSAFCYTSAQRALGAARTSTLYAAAPFIGTALSLAVLHEPVDIWFWPALAVMITGAWVAASNSRPHSHSGVRSIDYFAYESGMNGWNPAFKVAFSIGTLLICISAGQLWVSLSVIFVMGYLAVCKGGLPLGRYLSLLKIPLAFLLLSGLAVACDLSTQPVGDWNVSLHFFYVTVTLQRLIFALLLTLKALGAVSAMYLLALSTPANELTGVLRRAHLPSILVELMYLIYRFIFILLDTHARMQDAAQSRLGYCGFRTACRSFGMTAGNLLVVALKKSGAYYDAMQSRGYNGSLCFLDEDKPLCIRQLVWTAAFWAMLIALWVVN